MPPVYYSSHLLSSFFDRRCAQQISKFLWNICHQFLFPFLVLRVVPACC
jgi:hypothetical protein